MVMREPMTLILLIVRGPGVGVRFEGGHREEEDQSIRSRMKKTSSKRTS